MPFSKRSWKYLKDVEAGGKGARSEDRTMEAEHGASSSWFETDPNWTEDEQRDGATSALQDEEVVLNKRMRRKEDKRWSDYHDVNGVLKPLPVQQPWLKQPFTDVQNQLIAGIRGRSFLTEMVWLMPYLKLKIPACLQHQ